MRSWKDLPHSWAGRSKRVKIATFPKVVYRVNATSIKIVTPFFTELEENSKIHMEAQNSQHK